MPVVKFPGGEVRPPVPTAEDELRAVELELARARLEQTRAQTRQARAETRMVNSINFDDAWRHFKRALFWLFVAWLAWQFTGPAKAEGRTYYGANGSFQGSSVKRGSTISFYDHQGRFAGTELRRGKWRTFYGPNGRFTGTSIQR